MRHTNRDEPQYLFVVANANKKWIGSGFLVAQSDQCLLVTAFHVTQPSKDSANSNEFFVAPYQVRAPGEWKWYHARLFRSSQIDDISILAVFELPQELVETRTAALGAIESCLKNDSVRIEGNNEEDVCIHIASYDGCRPSQYHPSRKPFIHLISERYIGHGVSGGPIVHEMSGRVIGMLVSGYEYGSRWVEPVVKNQRYQRAFGVPASLIAGLCELPPPDRSDGSVDETSSLPLPIIGWNHPTVASPPRMYELAEPHMPIGISCCWGLTRGSLVGIVACAVEDGWLSHVLKTEHALFDVQRQQAIPELPVRYWVKPDWVNSIGPPDSEDRLLSQVLRLNPALKTATTDSLSRTILGVVLTVEPGQTQPANLEYLERWVVALTSHHASGYSPVVIVQLVGGNQAHARKVANQLKLRWEQRKDIHVPIEGYFTLSWSSSHSKLAKPGASNLVKLYDQVMEGYDSEHLQRHWPYDDLSAFVDSVRAECAGNDGVDYSMANVVGFMDNIRPDQDTSMDELLLRWLWDFSPEIMYEAIRAYANSACQPARLCALHFVLGVSPRLPALVEAWLRGSRLDLEYMPQLKDLSSAKEEHGGLALGMRYYERSVSPPNEEDSSRVREHLPWLKRLLDDFSTSESRLDLLAGGEAGTSVGKEPLDEPLFHYAVNLEYDTFPLADYLEAGRLSLPALWWWVATCIPDTSAVAAMLNLPHRFRSILGLVTAAEWQNILGDEQLLEQVLECRRHRPLKFL